MKPRGIGTLHQLSSRSPQSVRSRILLAEQRRLVYYDRDRGGDYHSNDDKSEDIENHDLLRLFLAQTWSRMLCDLGQRTVFSKISAGCSVL